MAITLLTPDTAERLPIRPYSGHCASALDFYANEDLYFAIGGTNPWPADESGKTESEAGFLPPEPNPADTDLDGLIGMKKVSHKILVSPDENGEISYYNSSWRSIDEDEAIALSARWVMLESTIYYTDLPAVPYRQIGVFSKVKRKAGVSSTQEILLPHEIESVGLLCVLYNRRLVTRQVDTKDVFQLILEL